MTTPGTAPDSAAAPRRRWPRRLAVLIGVVALLILLGPTLLGHRWVYQPLVDRLHAGEFQISVAEVRLGWLEPLELSGVIISEGDQPPLFAVERVRTDRGLLGLLWSGRRPGTLTLVRPTVDVHLLEEGTSFQRLVDAFDGVAPDDRRAPREPPAIDVDVQVQGLRVTVRSGEESVLLLETSPASFVASYRAADGNSELRLSKTRLLDRVELTPQLLDLGLQWILPPLAGATRADGRISLDLEQCRIPLDQPRQAEASGSVTIHYGRAGLEQQWASRIAVGLRLLSSRRIPTDVVLLRDVAVPFELADQRVRHSGFRFGLPEIDPRLQCLSRGAVGLDRTLDLEVEIPIPIEQLARREQVRSLGVPTITVPVGGTLDAPRVDWPAGAEQLAELAGLIGDSLGDEAPLSGALLRALEAAPEGIPPLMGAATDVLQEVLRRRREQRRDPSEDVESAPPSGVDAGDRQRRGPIRGMLQRLLRDRLPTDRAEPAPQPDAREPSPPAREALPPAPSSAEAVNVPAPPERAEPPTPGFAPQALVAFAPPEGGGPLQNFPNFLTVSPKPQQGFCRLQRLLLCR